MELAGRHVVHAGLPEQDAMTLGIATRSMLMQQRDGSDLGTDSGADFGQVPEDLPRSIRNKLRDMVLPQQQFSTMVKEFVTNASDNNAKRFVALLDRRLHSSN